MGSQAGGDAADRPAGSRPAALVTGASRGIGRAAALALADAGYDVAVTARTVREGEGRVPPRHGGGEDVPVTGSLQRTAAELEARGARAVPIAMDLLDAASVDAAADQATAALGRLDALVNSAIAHRSGVHAAVADLELDVAHEVLVADFLHQVRLTQRLLPALLADGGGVVVDVASGAARLAPPGPPEDGGWGLAYAAAKAAFSRLAPSLNAELWDRGLRAYDLSPGFVITEASRARGGAESVAARGYEPSSPEAAGAAIAWLVTSPEGERFRDRIVDGPRLVADRGLLDR